MTRLAGALLRGLHLAASLKAKARLVIQLHSLQKAQLSRSSLRHLSHLLTLIKVGPGECHIIRQAGATTCAIIRNKPNRLCSLHDTLWLLVHSVLLSIASCAVIVMMQGW